MAEAFLETIFPFKRHWFTSNGVKIHYVDEGVGRPIVMFHAFPLWSFSYRHLISEFSRDHRVIAFDLPGFGFSQGSEDFEYTLNGYINIVEVFLESLELKDMTLVLHGWGGTAGMGYAVSHPHQVNSLIILNTFLTSMGNLPFRLNLCKIPWIGPKLMMMLKILYSGQRHYQEESVRTAYMFNNDRDKLCRIMDTFIKDIPTVPESESFQRMMEIEAGLWYFRSVPSLILWAMQDWLYSPKLLKGWRRYLPDAEIHKIAGAGRYLQEDAAEELKIRIRNFFLKYHL